MSELQIAVAVFFLIGSLFLILFVLLLLLVIALRAQLEQFVASLRHQLEQLDNRVAHLEGDERACRVCGCTDAEACWPSGCWWTEPDLCSACDPTTVHPHTGTSLEGDR